jgi:hypothetical protein
VKLNSYARAAIAMEGGIREQVEKKKTSIWSAARDAICKWAPGFLGPSTFRAVIQNRQPPKSLWALKGSKIGLSESALDTLVDLQEPCSLPRTHWGPDGRDDCFPHRMYRGKDKVS